MGGIISNCNSVPHTLLYPANWELVSFEVQYPEILLAERMNTYHDQSELVVVVRIV